MAIRLATYNVEWFTKRFNADNTLKSDVASVKQLDAVAAVLKKIKADLVGIVEAPNNGGNQSTVMKLENFASHYGLSLNKALIGFPSKGQQEIAILYNDSKLAAVHKTGGSGVKNPPFNQEFRVDTDDDKIKEIYAHYRPPLEAEITVISSGRSFRLIVAHVKSKGIFSNMDRLNWERASRRNRLKIIAETTSIRKRIDEFIEQGHDVVAMGDINDGPGMDFYEFMYAKSGVEILMGDIFQPDRIVRSYGGRPKFGDYGWEPSSARFKDSFTGDNVNVLIDHVLASSGIKTSGQKPHRVWSPYQDQDAKAIKSELLEASDHFPVTLSVKP